MPQPSKIVFYSWQSDTPNRTNRTFIEDCLTAAITRIKERAAKLEAAQRPTELVLDKDTKGTPGSPPIADTILRKIRECSAFVADLTFVGKSLPELVSADEHARFFPNPNVLLEYGYALRQHGHEKIIGVFNTAFGPIEGNLPFDLNHLKWPIRYRYAKGEQVNPELKERFIKELIHALELILCHTGEAPSHTQFQPVDFPIESWDVVIANGELIGENLRLRPLPPFKLPLEGRCYLRLTPTEQPKPIDTELDARDLARQGNLRPMAGNTLTGVTVARNRYGALAYETPRDGYIQHFTQLFLTGELYGVDTIAMNTVAWRKSAEELISFDPCEIESSFAITLANYRDFASTILKIPPPWRVEAGIHGLKGYQLMDGYRCFEPAITWSGELGPNEPTMITLRPFFEKVWKKFGVQRPDSADEVLRSQLR